MVTNEREDDLVKRIALDKCHIEVVPVEEKFELRLVTTYAHEELMQFLDELRVAAEDVTSTIPAREGEAVGL